MKHRGRTVSTGTSKGFTSTTSGAESNSETPTIFLEELTDAL